MNLLLCPHCGGEAYLEKYTSAFPYEVRCKGCGATSPRLRSQSGAAEAWNRRTAPEERVTDLQRKVAAFSMLPNGWNSYGAKAFPKETITLAMEVARKLGDDWKAVPVADGAIEFYRSNEDEIIEVRTCFDPEPLPQK